jgi:hypothetical protein
MSRMKGSDASGSSRLFNALTSSIVRTGLEMMGPTPFQHGPDTTKRAPGWHGLFKLQSRTSD